jgi:hypothetical protein
MDASSLAFSASRSVRALSWARCTAALDGVRGMGEGRKEGRKEGREEGRKGGMAVRVEVVSICVQEECFGEDG